MEARELMVGNWVYDTVEKGEKQVWSIHLDRRNRLMINDAEIEMIDPIQLTKEWLVSLGAEKVSDNVFFFDRFKLRYLPEYEHWRVTSNGYYITKVEYVHELQNVVFVLNGEELS